jgi:EAL domain-containing protein (putative c-di-GMP-specific phosphodiesterase class I)/AmiR/NasT family two-component response regulator
MSESSLSAVPPAPIERAQPPRIRVLIADDEPAIREALADLLASEETLELVAVATDTDEAIDAARETMPDVALLDVKMPGGGGPRAAREILSAAPHTRIVALSAHEDRSSVLEMLRAGVVGYVVKGAAAEEILETVRRSVLGQASLSAHVTGYVVQELAGQLERQERASSMRRGELDRIRSVLDQPSLLRIAFQPIIDLRDGSLAGVEALSRFDAVADRPPDVWFAEATAVGLELELELTAVQAALADVDRIPEGAYLSLNMSPGTATSPQFGQLAAGQAPGRIVVEVTEHARVDSYLEVGAALRNLRSRGARLAIDDAGAGFASLRHILKLEPDLIKLDMSLTRGIDTDRAKRALAAGLISFAAEIDAGMVAEGIETEGELEALRGLGVVYGQGYFLARPGPLPDQGFSLPSLGGSA